jgi:hypothetical protein
MSADSVDRKNKNKVVAQIPKTSTVGVTTYPTQDFRDRTSADATDARNSYAATRETYGKPFNYLGATPAARSAYDLQVGRNQPVAQVTTVDPFAAYGGIEGLTSMLRGSGGGGSSTAAADALARDKFNAERSDADTASATSLRALQGLQGRLASGGYRGNADTLLDLIRGQDETGQASIWDNYNTGIGNINAGYDTAQGLVNTGYGDLNQYLGANQINPYANLQQQSSPVNNAMANYLSAYGVSNDPVSQQVQASQIANQGGADAFNQLQQLMSANQLANNQSNLDVSRMAQNYATTGLGSQRAAYQANADTARTTAMNQLMDQINQARFGVEEGVGTRRNALEEAIIGAGGSTSATAADVNPATGRVETGPAAAGSGNNASVPSVGSATSRAQQVAAAPDNYPNFKAALADLNPNYKFTTMAAAKKKFPALAKAF